jgi:3-hydroxybutyryl-CoA dehydratase
MMTEPHPIRRTKTMTRDWMVGHTTGLMSAGKGEQLESVVNIHTDEEFARRNALERPVPDGMVTGNWISSLMLDVYGRGYLERGALDVKFIRSTYDGDELTIVLEEQSRTPEDGGIRVLVSVRVERDPDDPVTVGSASAWIEA